MAATTEATEGPVLSLMTKRLRNLRKKHKRILQLEEEISQGKTLNKDQEEVLRSKPSVLTLIDEYEKLRHPLSTALQEELQQQQQKTEPAPSVQTEPVVEDLVKLMYFATLFDVKPQSDFTSTMYSRTCERECCLTYDYVTDDATDLLGEKDLDMISILGSLVVSRPGNSSISHKNALRSCLEHAKLWLANSTQPIDEGTDVTYAGLRERLNKILASDYYTTSPEMTAAVEVAAAAAAAAAGTYAPSSNVAVQGSSVSSEITVQTESDYAAYEEKDEGTEHSEGQEAGVDQSGSVEEHPKESEMGQGADGNAGQPDNKPEGDIEEQNHREVDSKDQHNPRKGYQNHRGFNRGGGGGGGRRGGYSNGRGGRGGRGGGGTGGYQNGRSSQYYEQSANYYPRNYYNPRGRGGGRGAGGNNGYSNARGGHVQADEVQS